MARDPINIFIFKDASDEDYANRLFEHIFAGKSSLDHVHILPMEPTGGEEVPLFFETQLKKAHFIVLLVSIKVLFKYELEPRWKLASQLHKDGNSKTRVIPILARHCDYQDWLAKEFPLSEIFILNKQPLSKHNDALPYQKYSQLLFELINKTEKDQAPKERSAKEKKQFAGLLSQLNYTEQPVQFQEAQLLSKQNFKSNKTFAYLIKGEEGFGQNWLYSILRQKAKDPIVWGELEDIDDIPYEEIPLSFGSVAMKTNPDAIWRSLGKTLKISNNARAEQVVDDLCNTRAKNRILVLRFEDFGTWTEEMGRQFMEVFWKTIVEGAANPSDSKIRYPIFMFLIDHSKAYGTCPITFLSGSSTTWNPEKGITLEELDSLSFEVVEKWLRDHRIAFTQFDPKLISTLSNKEKLKDYTTELLKDSEDGKPDIVLENVSQKFNFNFFDIQEQLAENE